MGMRKKNGASGSAEQLAKELEEHWYPGWGHRMRYTLKKEGAALVGLQSCECVGEWLWARDSATRLVSPLDRRVSRRKGPSMAGLLVEV